MFGNSSISLPAPLFVTFHHCSYYDKKRFCLSSKPISCLYNPCHFGTLFPKYNYRLGACHTFSFLLISFFALEGPLFTTGVQKMDVCNNKFISDKLSSVQQFWLRTTHNPSYFSIFCQLVMQTFSQCCVQHANNWKTVEQILGHSCVQQSNGWFMLCPTLQWLVS